MDRWKYKKDRMLNEEICLKIDVAPIDEKMRESHLIWFRHVQRIVINAPVRKEYIDWSWGNEEGWKKTQTNINNSKKWCINKEVTKIMT